MSDETEKPQQLTVLPKREVRVVHDESPIAYLLDTSRFEHVFRIAGAMARASLIPKHLKGDSFEQTQANCFLVVNQALRWQMDPFAVAPETYEVGGKLGFSGKLVAAVINARGGLSERLSYTFNGAKGDDLEITVSGTLEGESEPRTVSMSVKQGRTTNQMWTKDPEQKLVYSAATKWARRHKPEVILGVLTDDDLDALRQEEKEKAYQLNPPPSFSGAVVDVPPTPEPVAAQVAPPAEPKPQRAKSPKAHNTAKAPVELPLEPASPPADVPHPDPEPAASTGDDVTKLRAILPERGITEAKVLAWCKANSRFCEDGEPAVKLEQLPSNIIAGLLKNITLQGPIVKAIAAMPDSALTS